MSTRGPMEVRYQEPSSVRAGRAPRDHRAKDATDDYVNLRSIRKEVAALGASQFKGRSKREWREREEAALGIRKQRGVRMPLSILQGLRRKKAMRNTKAEEEALASGSGAHVAMRKRRHAEKAASRGPRDPALNASVGVFSSGVLRLQGDDLERIKASKRGRDFDAFAEKELAPGRGRPRPSRPEARKRKHGAGSRKGKGPARKRKK